LIVIFYRLVFRMDAMLANLLLTCIDSCRITVGLCDEEKNDFAHRV